MTKSPTWHSHLSLRIWFLNCSRRMRSSHPHDVKKCTADACNQGISCYLIFQRRKTTGENMIETLIYLLSEKSVACLECFRIEAPYLKKMNGTGAITREIAPSTVSVQCTPKFLYIGIETSIMPPATTYRTKVAPTSALAACASNVSIKY